MLNVNDVCIFNGTKGKERVVILDKKSRMGASIQNDSMQTMDLSLNTYYKINYFGNEIWVTENFLNKE